jgi:hypothetical protein
MTPFLKQIAEIFYDKYGNNIHNLAFIFPNRRAGVFFSKYLSEVAVKPIFAPSIITINNLFYKLNDKQQADKIKLLFLLYDIYIKKSGNDESFDDFVYWGEMLLNDFDDIDKYLINARQLFTNVKDLNKTEHDFGFLETNQINAIRSFWSSFNPDKEDKNQQFFLKIWEILYPIYVAFRERLSEEQLAYEGMIYREVADNIDRYIDNISYNKIIFIGLNALTGAEIKLMKALKSRGIADFYWDYSSEKLKDSDNKASFFMKENIEIFPSEIPLQEENHSEPTINIIGVPSRIGQAKQVYSLIEKLFNDKTDIAGQTLKTAIILPDEQLLIPVLNSIPESIRKINITIGYSLNGTPISSFMEFINSLQKNRKESDGETSFYYNDVISILQHKYVYTICKEDALSLIKEITENNRVYIGESKIPANGFLKILFASPKTAIDISAYLIIVLKELSKSFTSKEEDTTEEDTPINSNELEQEFIFHYYTIVNRMSELISDGNIEMSSETYFNLLKQLTDLIKIPFNGEPLSGLQIMGVLETRALDFDNLIILSVNEGVFPSKSISNSFIPYNLRRGFGLPAYEHQESVWAYHFYRMISRAKNVTLLYDTRSGGLQSGEASRFVHQLKYHYKVPINEKLTIYNISSSRGIPISIEKDKTVMEELSKFETDKALSASVINTYLDCPLKFYLSAVKGIEEEDTVSETIENDRFGTILHKVMELSYNPFCEKEITDDLLRLASEKKNMTLNIEKAFAKDFFHIKEVRPLTGQTYLYGETIRKYACKILEFDSSLTPFKYVTSEKKVDHILEISNNRKIKLKGFIDRIDLVDNKTLRVVDYKSGKVSKLEFDTMDRLFDIRNKDRRKAIMQVFFYSWILIKKKYFAISKIQPAIYYTRNLFANGHDPSIRQSIEKDKIIIDDFGKSIDDFEDSLRNCINEMFDERIPFIQTSNIHNCSYCYFAGICSR